MTREPFVDKGHYTDVPVPSGEGIIHVLPGESYRKVIVLDPQSESTSIPKGIVAEKDTIVDLCVVILPGVCAEIPLDVFLTGEGANVSLSGIFLCCNDEKVSFRTQVLHLCGGCVSDQKFNGIASGKSAASFFGRIVVAPDAQKTQAYQSNRNILLSEDARISTKPQLEIYADDVKCSHGATTGRLDEDEQFYMRSRGIPEDEAKVLQMISFISPVIAHIEDPELRESISARVENAIRKMA